MEAKEFIALLTDHEKVEHQSVEELKRLSLEFPYSQPVQLLYTIRLSQSSEYLFNRQLGKTAILTNDRTLLFDLFEREEDRVVETSFEAPSVLKSLPYESEFRQVEKEDPVGDAERLENSVLRKVAEEKSPEINAEAREGADKTSGEEPSMKEKVRAILEENRRLREKYEGSQKENTAINQRIDEIKDRLDQIKGKQEKIAEKVIHPGDEVYQPDIIPQETPEEGKQGKDYHSIDEEALIAERKSGDAPELLTERDTDFSLPNLQVDKVGSVFTIDEEPASTDLRGEEELPFSAWIQRLSQPEVKVQSKSAPEKEAFVSRESDTSLSAVSEEMPKEAAPEERPALTAKFELFDSFVEKLPELKRRKPESMMNLRQEEDLSEEESSLVTETLAKVYAKQKHYDKAIKAYEILRLKYPEKSGFFADRIFEIKKLINS